MSKLDLNSVKAGEYELLALSWDQITSKPGQPLDYITRRKGDVVTLDVEQARRLMSAGAVKPVAAKKSKEKTDPDKGQGTADPADGEKPSFDAGIDKIMAYVGEDKERAAEYLTAEKAKGDAARSTLVDKLQAVIGDAGAGS